jgi:hypothetical protein
VNGAETLEVSLLPLLGPKVELLSTWKEAESGGGGNLKARIERACESPVACTDLLYAQVDFGSEWELLVWP